VYEARPDSGGWLNYEAAIPTSGHYVCKLSVANARKEPVKVWLEDLGAVSSQSYLKISGDYLIPGNMEGYQDIRIPHCSLLEGTHWFRIHFSKGGVAVNSVRFSLESVRE
jgi:hypothetical protein